MHSMCQTPGSSMQDVAEYYQNLSAWISLSWKYREPRDGSSYRGIRICAGTSLTPRKCSQVVWFWTQSVHPWEVTPMY